MKIQNYTSPTSLVRLTPVTNRLLAGWEHDLQIIRNLQVHYKKYPPLSGSTFLDKIEKKIKFLKSKIKRFNHIKLKINEYQKSKSLNMGHRTISL